MATRISDPNCLDRCAVTGRFCLNAAWKRDRIVAQPDDVSAHDVDASEGAGAASTAAQSKRGKRNRPPRSLPFVRDEEVFTEADALSETLDWIQKLENWAEEERGRWEWRTEEERELLAQDRKEPPARFDKDRAERLVRRLHRLGVRRKEVYVLTNALFLSAFFLTRAIAPV
jgi:hypothetical protein